MLQLVFVLETVVSVPYAIGVAVDSLTAVYCDDVVIATTSVIIGVDMLAGADANSRAAVMVDLKLIMPSSLADSVPVCREASSC